jgi:steroid 5-alpha reductase family enzyme
MNAVRGQIDNFLQFLHIIRKQTYIEKMTDKLFDFHNAFSLHADKLNLTDTLTPFYINLVIQFTFWIYSLFNRDMTPADPLWGLSFVVQAAVHFFKSFRTEEQANFNLLSHFKSFYSHKNFSIEKLTFTTIVIVHSLRLAAYLFFRRKNNLEDKRYAWMRSKLGKHFFWFSWFFLCIPMVITNHVIGLLIYAFNKVDLSIVKINQPLYWNGILMMIVGSLFQSIADQQMYNFKTSPRNKGQILDNGLWALCRHPNYFGDTVFWWGAYVCNLSVGIHWTFISPLTLTIAILFITGIPLLESFMVQDHGDLYRDYQNRVSAFIPYLFNAKGAKGKNFIRKFSNNVNPNIHDPNDTSAWHRDIKGKNWKKTQKNKNRKGRRNEKPITPDVSKCEFYKTLQ